MQNGGAKPVVERLAIDSGEERQFPVRIFVADGETTQEHVIARPGRIVVELPEVLPGSRRLFILWTDQAWTPRTADQRLLGVKLSAG